MYYSCTELLFCPLEWHQGGHAFLPWWHLRRDFHTVCSNLHIRQWHGRKSNHWWMNNGWICKHLIPLWLVTTTSCCRHLPLHICDHVLSCVCLSTTWNSCEQWSSIKNMALIFSILDSWVMECFSVVWSRVISKIVKEEIHSCTYLCAYEKVNLTWK